MLGTTWYQAHVVAVGLALIAIGIALKADRPAVDEAMAAVGADEAGGEDAGSGQADERAGFRARVGSFVDGVRAELSEGLHHGPQTLIDRRQFLAGFALGLAATARLTVAFGLPFLILVGGGRGPLRRTLSAGLGLAVPLLALVAYNVVTTGHIFHPAYEYLYQQEVYGYPELGYNRSWSIEDLRYIPQNLGIMLAGLPDIMPACPPGDAREPFSATCAFVVPNPVGMSLLLTSPAYLLAIPALLDIARSRIVAGAAIAIFAIAFVNLMHFSQGWVQFGYRFSNDFAPFALLLVALGIAAIGRIRGWVAVLIAISIAVNLWGVAWGNILGW